MLPNGVSEKRPAITNTEWIVLAIFVVLGVAGRFWIEMPNFKPVAAFALFGGFYFRRPCLAVIGMILVMGVSDAMLGIYAWQLMACVYVSMAVSVLLGISIRNRLGNSGLSNSGLSVSHWVAFVGASLTMSTIFYLLTNGACWLMGGWYPRTMAGLAECYLAGLPFYRWTLAGDLFFTTVTVGTFSLALLFSGLGQYESEKPATELLSNS